MKYHNHIDRARGSAAGKANQDRVKEFQRQRKRLCLTQGEIAARINCSTQLISAWATFRAPIPDDRWEQVQALFVQVEGELEKQNRVQINVSANLRARTHNKVVGLANDLVFYSQEDGPALSERWAYRLICEIANTMIREMPAPLVTPKPKHDWGDEVKFEYIGQAKPKPFPAITRAHNASLAEHKVTVSDVPFLLSDDDEGPGI